MIIQAKLKALLGAYHNFNTFTSANDSEAGVFTTDEENEVLKF